MYSMSILNTTHKCVNVYLLLLKALSTNIYIKHVHRVDSVNMNSLTSWSQVFTEKLRTFYSTQMFINVLPRAWHSTIPATKWIQFTPSHPIYLWRLWELWWNGVTIK